MPLTLAIADGMIVAVGDQTLVIPLTHIVESLRPRPEEVRRLGGGKFMLNVRGQFLPVQHIGGKLGIEGAQTDPAQARSEEHTSALQSLMRLSYAVFCLKKTKRK